MKWETPPSVTRTGRTPDQKYVLIAEELKTNPKEWALILEQGQPLIFGTNKDKGIRLNGHKPEVVKLGEGFSADDLWIHDEKDFFKAQILTRLFDNPHTPDHFPRPFGVFFQTQRTSYEDAMAMQIDEFTAKKGKGNLDKLLQGNETWVID